MSKTAVRRTRSVSAVIDSPVRRSTRSTRQLSTIDSSLDSLDETAQTLGRTTRSRTGTLDKPKATTVVKNLRSRKTSMSSDVSESLEMDSEIAQKRITRKIAQAAVGTPTKLNSRT